jgi:hypothetical protein
VPIVTVCFDDILYENDVSSKDKHENYFLKIFFLT